MKKYLLDEHFLHEGNVISFGATYVDGGQVPTNTWEFDVLEDGQVVHQEMVQLSEKDLALIKQGKVDERLLVSMKFAHQYRYREVSEGGAAIPGFNYQKLSAPAKEDKKAVRGCLLQTIHGFYEQGITTSTLFEILLSCDFSKQAIKQAIDWCEGREWLVHRGQPYPVLQSAYQLNASKIIEIERFLESPRQMASLHHHFQEVTIDVTGPFVFVIMPFREKEFPQRIYHEVIKPLAWDEFKMPCVRVDEDYLPSNTLNKIYTHTRKCEFVIAETSTRNANVLYELGMAHALGKDVIIIENKNCLTEGEKTKFIFDIDKFPCHRYTDDNELRDKLRKAVFAHTRASQRG